MIDRSTACRTEARGKEKTILPQEKKSIRILIIPHQPNRNVKVRSLELARHLAALPGFEVYVFTWRLSEARQPHPWDRIIGKIGENLKSFTLKPQIVLENGIRWVSLPYLLNFTPLCQAFNERQLSQFIEQRGIDAIISANAYHFPMPEQPDVFRIYDIVDDHLSAGSTPNWRHTRQFTLNEVKKASHTLVVGRSLQQKCEQEGIAQSVIVTNGMDLSASQPNPEAIHTIREKYQLEGRFTFGYIGNHGAWAGLDFLLEAFKKAHSQAPNTALMIVGPVENLPHYQQLAEGHPAIIFTNAIPPEDVTHYFQTIDLGILSSKPEPFRDNAMPLKILEYGAAKKRVLATPLRELTLLNFPHVRLLEMNAHHWSEAMVEESQRGEIWHAEWDQTLAPYDWETVWQPVDQLLAQRFTEGA